jgi:hypothetical protein
MEEAKYKTEFAEGDEFKRKTSNANIQLAHVDEHVDILISNNQSCQCRMLRSGFYNFYLQGFDQHYKINTNLLRWLIGRYWWMLWKWR